MKRLLIPFERVPPSLLFAGAALVEIGLITMMIADHAAVLRNGREIVVAVVRPVDPRDFMRGDYVTFRYDVSHLGSGHLAGQRAKGKQPYIYVRLSVEHDGRVRPVSLSLSPFRQGSSEIMLRGKLVGGANCGRDRNEYCPGLELRYGIERFFVPEGEGYAPENARNQSKLAVVAAVGVDGRAQIKRLLIDGQPAYEEPLY